MIKPFPQVGVGVVIINKSDEILLVKRGNHPNKGKWTIPGGHLEPGETIISAAKREIYEETGLKINNPVLIDAVDLIQKNENGELLKHYILIDYAVREFKGIEIAGSDATEIKWVDKSQIKNYVEWDKTVKIITKSLQNKTINK